MSSTAGTSRQRSSVEDYTRQPLRALPCAGLAQEFLDWLKVEGLYDLAQRSLLERAWHENIAGKLQIVFNATRKADLALKEPVQKHELIVSPIASQNVERARDLAARHIDDAWQRAQSTLKGRGSSSSPAERLVT